MGCIYKRESIYWIKYYRAGKPYSESSHSDREAAAKKLLKGREGEISKGELPGIYFNKVLFDDLAEDFLADYEINHMRTLKKARIYVKHLQAYFGGIRIVDITTDRVRHYIQEKLDKGRKNATINRELAALKRMLSLGHQSRKVRDLPYIPSLKENNVRQGFFEYTDFLTIREALPNHLRPVVTFAYYTGWRRGEILNLIWDRVDLKQGIIRIESDETKNKKAEKIYLTGELLEVMQAMQGRRRLGCPYIFHLDGKPIKEFNKAWNRICQKIGLKGKLFHDLRRTAVRNLVRAQVNERVAMEISGHKTRSVFDRYNITSDEDLKEAAIKLQTSIKSWSRGEKRDAGKVVPFKTVTETVTMAI